MKFITKGKIFGVTLFVLSVTLIVLTYHLYSVTIQREEYKQLMLIPAVTTLNKFDDARHEMGERLAERVMGIKSDKSYEEAVNEAYLSLDKYEKLISAKNTAGQELADSMMKETMVSDVNQMRNMLSKYESNVNVILYDSRNTNLELLEVTNKSVKEIGERLHPLISNEEIAMQQRDVSFMAVIWQSIFAIIGISVFLIIVSIVAFVIVHNISKPISSLKATTNQIANGDFNARVSVTGNDEISDLSTDVNKMALALRKSQKETKDIMNLLDRSSLVSITDKDGNIIYANDVFCKVSKYTKEELIGSNHRIIKSGFHPPEFYKNIWKTIYSGNVWQGEIKNKAKDGTFYWVRTLIAPIFDGIVTPVRYISIRTNITVERELQEKNLKREKLSAIGELSARLAHDLRNPLSVIKNTVEVLKLKNQNISDVKTLEQYSRLDRAINRISNQIENVLDFVRITPLEMNNYSISEIIHDVFDRVPIPDGIKIKLPQNDVKIICDSKRLEIVFINLVTNAIQAIGEKGEISVSIIDDEDSVCIQVADSGPGIPDNIISRIFEPLFTTKQTGTGLGLASCKTIVEQHGGTLTVKNNPTTFTVKLSKLISDLERNQVIGLRSKTRENEVLFEKMVENL